MIIGAAAAAAIGRVAAPTTQVYSVNSANLDGVNDAFNLGNVANLGTSNFYITFFLKTTATSGQIISKDNGSFVSFDCYINGSEMQYRIYVDGSNFRAFITSGANINDGNWHSVRFAIDRASGTSVCFIDDNQATINSAGSSGSITGNFSNAAPWKIGARDTGTPLHLQSQVSFVGLAFGELTAQKEDLLYNEGLGLCYAAMDNLLTTDFDNGGFYLNLCNFNGNTGTETDDQTINGFNATNEGSTPFTGTGLSVECT